MDERAQWILAQLMSPGIGHAQINATLDAVHGDFDTLAQRTDVYVAAPDPWIERLNFMGISWLTRWDTGYPQSLHALKLGAPPLLFIRGPVTSLQTERIGIVGARTASNAGLDAARDIAAACASAKTAVVSGGAQGADRAAHEGAIEAGGSTIVVLPCGICDRESTRHFERWMQTNRVTLVSPFVPDLAWSTHAAMERNKVIAALSEALCVIEPGDAGGSLRTARFALGLRKPVHVYGESEGAKLLFREGAVMFSSVTGADPRGLLAQIRRSRENSEQTLF